MNNYEISTMFGHFPMKHPCAQHAPGEKLPLRGAQRTGKPAQRTGKPKEVSGDHQRWQSPSVWTFQQNIHIPIYYPQLERPRFSERKSVDDTITASHSVGTPLRGAHSVGNIFNHIRRKMGDPLGGPHILFPPTYQQLQLNIQLLPDL